MFCDGESQNSSVLRSAVNASPLAQPKPRSITWYDPSGSIRYSLPALSGSCFHPSRGIDPLYTRPSGSAMASLNRVSPGMPAMMSVSTPSRHTDT